MNSGEESALPMVSSLSSASSRYEGLVSLDCVNRTPSHVTFSRVFSAPITVSHMTLAQGVCARHPMSHAHCVVVVLDMRHLRTVQHVCDEIQMTRETRVNGHKLQREKIIILQVVLSAKCVVHR